MVSSSVRVQALVVVIVAICIATVVTATNGAAVSVGTAPDQCCFAKMSPYRYVYNATSVDTKTVWSSEFKQVDPIANKTYWEQHDLAQDGTWMNEREWQWYNTDAAYWMTATKYNDGKCDVVYSHVPAELTAWCIGAPLRTYDGDTMVGAYQMYRYANKITPSYVATTIVDPANCAPVFETTYWPGPNVKTSSGAWTDVSSMMIPSYWTLPSDCQAAVDTLLAAATHTKPSITIATN